jgi:hypothetical protein
MKMIKQTLEEWREEAKSRFGERGRDWKFVCPSCSNIQSGQDFIDIGMTDEQSKNKAYQSCIGRETKEKGCNWAAYGFLGTLGKGRSVITPEGDEVEVFDFARSAIETNEQPSKAAAG